MSANYRVTPEAETDLIEIWNYSAREFGERQADRYLAQIEADVERLAEGLLAGGVCSRLIPGAATDLRYWKSGQHYLVFRHPEARSWNCLLSSILKANRSSNLTSIRKALVTTIRRPVGVDPSSETGKRLASLSP